MRYFFACIVVAAAISIGALLWSMRDAARTQTNGMSGALVAACRAYPNNSSHIVADTSRLTIFIPKSIYPNQYGLLPFKTVNGSASAHWISNAGPIGDSYGSSAYCRGYYYEFDGNGEVDLVATSSIAGVPSYVLHFIVGQSAHGAIQPPLFLPRAY